MFDIHKSVDQNFIIEIIIDKPFDFDKFSEIVSDKLIKIYIKAINIYNEFAKSKGIKSLSISKR